MFLHRVLSHAVRMQLLSQNPADSVERPVRQHVEMRTLDEVQVGAVFTAAEKTPYFSLFHTALFTGMRRSELLGLRWSDVDLIMAEVTVNRALHHLSSGGFIIRGTKTTRSTRSVALAPESCNVLRRHLDNEQLLCLEIGMPFKNDRYLFCKWDGSPLIPHTVTQAWRRLTSRLGIWGVRFHDLRHTHATMMLKQGIHPRIVQERMGHSSIAITLDVYSHVTPGMQQEAARSFGQLFDEDIRRRLDGVKIDGDN